jgi:hypothetical protein
MALHALQFPPKVLPGFRVPDKTPVKIGLIALRKNLEQVQGLPLAFIGDRLHRIHNDSPHILMAPNMAPIPAPVKITAGHRQSRRI